MIGRGAAVARIFGAHLSGFIAGLVWLFVHRGARLITGEGVKEE